MSKIGEHLGLESGSDASQSCSKMPQIQVHVRTGKGLLRRRIKSHSLGREGLTNVLHSTREQITTNC